MNKTETNLLNLVNKSGSYTVECGGKGNSTYGQREFKAAYSLIAKGLVLEGFKDTSRIMSAGDTILVTTLVIKKVSQ